MLIKLGTRSGLMVKDNQLKFNLNIGNLTSFSGYWLTLSANFRVLS
mgnify:FL=1